MRILQEVAITNHPNRSKANRGGARNPTPAEVLAAREKAGLTQTEAGELIYGTLRTWQDWESGERRMHPQMFEAFLLKTGQMQRSFYEELLDKKEGKK